MKDLLNDVNIRDIFYSSKALLWSSSIGVNLGKKILILHGLYLYFPYNLYNHSITTSNIIRNIETKDNRVFYHLLRNIPLCNEEMVL